MGRGGHSRRWSPDADNRLVVALGRADVAAGLSLARSRLNLANILDVADQRRIPAFVVGPPPGGTADARQARRPVSRVRGRGRPGGGCRSSTPTRPLAAHDQWLGDLAAGDGVLPGQAGYGLMAWLVLHTGWHAWLGLPDDGA